MPPATSAILVPFSRARDSLAPATEVRSTLLSASIDAMRRSPHYERYLSLLPAQYREEFQLEIAGVWLPMETALAHYAAVDALGFTEAETLENGYSVGARLNGTFLGPVLKLAAQATATPWLPLTHAGRLFDRVFRGGAGVQIERAGPKEARLEIAALPIAASPYFRGALRGQIQAGCELFCRRCYTREIDTGPKASSTTLRVSWV